MTTYDGFPEGVPEREEGRTEAQLHQPWDNHRDDLAGGGVHSIAERLDGTYVADSGGEYQCVHGWYYPDPGDRALPQVGAKAA